jgi:hypothetical protein
MGLSVTLLSLLIEKCRTNRISDSRQVCNNANTAIGSLHSTPHRQTMKRSATTDAQPATKRTRRRTKSTPEKRQSTSQRKQRERSNASGTAQADIARENDRLRMQRSRASNGNTPPPSQQASALFGEAMPAVRTVHRPPMTTPVPAAASGQSAPCTATCCNAHASFAPIGCANASSNDGF